MIKTFLATNDSPALLIIRLALGIVMFPHGAQKVFGWFGQQKGEGFEYHLLVIENNYVNHGTIGVIDLLHKQGTMYQVRWDVDNGVFG